MEGFDVLTFDGDKAGKVIGRQGDYLVVEQGAIFKHRRALPAIFATVDEGEGVVRTTLSRELLEGAPKVENEDEIDEPATARHYGLAAGEAAPATRGYGDVAPGDPALGAEQQETRNGQESAAEQRAARSHTGAGQGPNDRG